eukprot:scaffold31419_cov39-Tisochrysis_lutea.AAC.1
MAHGERGKDMDMPREELRIDRVPGTEYGGSPCYFPSSSFQDTATVLAACAPPQEVVPPGHPLDYSTG